MPASWSETGFTALFITESPEVRFDDVIVKWVKQVDTCIEVDPRFVEVCERGSVEVFGCQSHRPTNIGAVVNGGKVHLRFAEQDPSQEHRVVLRLTGIRKGFAGMRFPDRTRNQFEHNERFIRSAYPDE